MAGVQREHDLVLNEEWEAIEEAMREILPAQLEAMPPEQRASLGTPDEIITEELLRMRNWTLKVFPKANHLFQDAETGNPDEYFRLDPVIAPEVLDAISTWIRERGAA